MGSWIEEQKTEMMRRLQRVFEGYEDTMDLPYDNSEPEITLSKDADDRHRYWVIFNGEKIGWVYRRGASRGRHAEWRAYVRTGAVKGHEPRGYDPSKRRYAAWAVITEGFRVAKRGWW